MTQDMRAFRRQVDLRTLHGEFDDSRDTSGLGKADMRGMMSQKDPSAVGMGPTVLQVIGERLPDFLWQGHYGAFTPLGAHRQSTFKPVDIIQCKGRDLYSAQSKPREDHQ